MSKTKSSASKKKLPLDKCIEGFLGLTFRAPEKMPKQQYREREIFAEIRGFNKAQETLRNLLELNGTPTAAKLKDVRAKGQIRPERQGNTNLWMASP